MTPAETKWETARRWGWLPVVLAVGLTARFWAGTCGHNYDLGSYWVVVDLVEHGQNVYAGTNRYNYGPVWFHLLHLFDWLAGGNSAGFRFLIIGFLSAADALIAWILWRKFGRLVAAWFFLNPVSIMITGYGNQFDNVAILLGLWAVLLLGDDFEGPIDRRKFAGLVVLGLSLMTKHVFFAFPFWLAVRQRGLWQKGVVLLVPVAVFLAGFAPYWAGGRASWPMCFSTNPAAPRICTRPSSRAPSSRWSVPRWFGSWSWPGLGSCTGGRPCWNPCWFTPAPWSRPPRPPPINISPSRPRSPRFMSIIAPLPSPVSP
jgi:hypothetical protein